MSFECRVVKFVTLTYILDLRLQLLEPERFPYLYKCLYGILMLLPQSAAFAALKNRLNSVSAIGYLHIPAPAGPPRPTSSSLAETRAVGGTTVVPPAFERASRLKPRDDGTNTGQSGPVKWTELLEKFRNAQDRARRASRPQTPTDDREIGKEGDGSLGLTMTNGRLSREGERRSGVPRLGDGKPMVGSAQAVSPIKDAPIRSKFGAAGLSRLTGGVKSKTKR